jgi:uncharacterized protein (DUF1697 family)
VTTYVALLRGINVGGNKRVPMADLRELLRGLGFQDVRSLLQSGNAVLVSSATPSAIEKDIETALVTHFGFQVRVLVRTGAELAAVVANNPWREAVEEPKKLHVAFLDAAPKKGWDVGLKGTDFTPEQYCLRGRELYVWYRNGLMDSKLNVPLFRAVKVTATLRNWNTVTKLGELAS